MTDARKYTVLLADDVEALRKLVRLAIEGSGRFQVVAEAATGIEAIAKAAEAHPDLVLLDLSMPELDGLEALPRVLEASPGSHVVVLSGFNHVRMAPIATRLGASAYLEKGLEPTELSRALLEVLEPGQAQDMANGGPPPAAQQARRQPDPPAPPSAAPAKASAAAFRVLLVESDSALAGLVSQLLDRPGSPKFEVMTVLSAAQAGLRLGADPIDLVLVDPLNAGGEPEEALIEILSHAAAIPVVALLPGTATDLSAGALRLGIEDCLRLEDLDADLLGRSLLYAIERRRAHEARLLVRDQHATLVRMRELEAIKTQFFNAAAHEMGTPLTPIRLQLALLKKITASSAGAAERRSIEILDRNVQRLAQLNQDILDVARLQAGRLSVERRPIDLSELVRDVRDDFDPLARSAGVRLVVRCQETVATQADPQRLAQVLFNLVNNAIKFTPRGGEVTLEVSAADHECRVAVRDTGIGLRPDQIAQLFQPFSQVLGSEQPPGVGTGLGLFVSRGIVELHGGHIWCQSAGPGQGACFMVALPSLANHLDPRPMTHEALAVQSR